MIFETPHSATKSIAIAKSSTAKRSTPCLRVAHVDGGVVGSHLSVSLPLHGPLLVGQGFLGLEFDCIKIRLKHLSWSLLSTLHHLVLVLVLAHAFVFFLRWDD